MKKNIFSILFLLVVTGVTFSQSQTINMNGKKIIFGSTSAEFMNVQSDFQLCTDENSFESIKVYCNNIKGGDDQSFSFSINVYFLNDELFLVKIDEWFAPEDYRDIIRKLVKQFKVTKEESSDEEGGWFHQDLKKGKLKGSYDEADAASRFKCFEVNIMAKVKQQYPDFDK